MKRLALPLVLLLALLVAPAPVFGQDIDPPDGTLIESAEISGLPRDQLGAALLGDIDALAGQPLSRERVDALAARVEAEHPEMLAAVRYLALADGRTRVMFLVGRISDDAALSSNINSRYTIEDVDLRGVGRDRISKDLRDDLDRLVGERLNNEQIFELINRLKAELPDYDIHHSVSRGHEVGRLRVVFVARRTDRSYWIPFFGTPSKIVYQQDQGWSTALNLAMSGNRTLFNAGLVLWNNDDFVEEYSGFRLRFQTREAGTKRLGVAFDFLRYTQDWEPVTLGTLATTPNAPRPYDTRLTVEPAVTVAFARHLTLTAGFSASELDPFVPEIVDPPVDPVIGPLPSQRVNAGMATVAYDGNWKRSSGTHRLDSSYQWRSASRSLDSDLEYTRHFGHARYQFEHRQNMFIASFMLGRISGQAPLFERFVLGDSSTLRGWDKYSIAPIGADRLMHQSVEYRFKNFAYFLDSGSVWSEGQARKIRVATGVGFHASHFFVTYGVPLNAGDLWGKFILGVRY